MLPVTRGLDPRIDLAAGGRPRATSGSALVEGVTATERGPQLVEQGLMLATALAPVIGYDEAAKLAKAALASGRTIRELALERGMDPADLDRLLDPAAMTEPGLGDREALAAADARYNPRQWPRHESGIAPPPSSRPTAAAGRRSRRCRPGCRPSRQLFDFMRDAELRFATLRLRVEERRSTLARRGDDDHRSSSCAIPARPRSRPRAEGERGKADYEIWISDGDLVRTYAAAHRLGTQRPIRNRPRGLDDRDFPGSSRVYEPVTALPTETLPETFIHPAGYCQNVLATGRAR